MVSNFTMEETKKKTKGTDAVVLYISTDSNEFLEEIRLSTILNKYCKFLRRGQVWDKKQKK